TSENDGVFALCLYGVRGIFGPSDYTMVVVAEHPIEMASPKMNVCLTSFSSKMVLLPTGPMKFVRLWTTFSLAVGLSKTFVIFRCGDLDIKTCQTPHFALQPFFAIAKNGVRNICGAEGIIAIIMEVKLRLENFFPVPFFLCG
ncbi:hypothetical protein L9F63_018116, partial [Diploptera punctata]